MTRPLGRQPQEGRRMHISRLFLTAVLLVMVISGFTSQLLAQERALDWVMPVNLSQSGAASSPMLVSAPGGSLRVFWWDLYDGLTMSEGTMSSALATDTATGTPADWSTPSRVPIVLVETVERGGQQVQISIPIESMPRIMGDADGWAHAFWLGEASEETDKQSLMYSRLAPGGSSWTPALSLIQAASSFDVAADASGTLHLAYVRPVETALLPMGLYYQRSLDSGATWSVPELIQQSRYLRLLPPEGASLGLTADGPDTVHVTWNDLSQAQVLVAQSADGGKTWQEPRPYAVSDEVPLNGGVIAVPGRAGQVSWKPSGEEEGLMLASSGENALTLARWIRGHWSETKHLILDLEDLELGAHIELGDLQLVLASDLDRQGEDGRMLAAAGLDRNNDVWITGIPVEALESLWDAPPDYPTSLTPGEGQTQAEAERWVNLSLSGAASKPAIVAGSSGTVRAFWWDEYDGLMVSDGALSTSAQIGGTEEILVPSVSWSEARPAPLPVQTVPRILTDARGRIHAFWLQPNVGQAQDTAQVVGQPLMHSFLTADGIDWSSPLALAEAAIGFDVATEATGALHVAYIGTQPSPSAPATIYHRRTEQDGAGWTAPAAVHDSRYLRSLSPEAAYLRLAVADEGGVWVTWDDPRLDHSLLAYSPDGGVSWEPATMVGASGETSQKARVFAVPGAGAMLFWEAESATSTCSLYQAAASEALTGDGSAGHQILEGLVGCPEDAQLLAIGPEQALMVMGAGGNVLTLVVWDGDQWSEPTRWSFDFEYSEMGERVHLDGLQLLLIEPFSGDLPEGASMALVVIGSGGAGDIWAAPSDTGELEVLFAPPPAWSAPVIVSVSEAQPDLPAMVADGEGWVHTVWTESASTAEAPADLMYARWDGVAWTQPVTVLDSTEDGVRKPVLVAQDDLLHAAWCNQSGEILYSHAFAQDAYATRGWSEPILLSGEGTFASEPDLVVDTSGVLHAVYAVPVNEDRGIYYTRSTDGETWSRPRQVFDAVGAGWVAAGQPQVAVDAYGFLHVAWFRTLLPVSGLPEGIYYSRSLDGGETWSEPLDVAIGTYGGLQVMAATEGRVHLVWKELSGQDAWWHQYSSDAGEMWTTPERINGFEGVEAPARLMADSSGALHLVGILTDEDGLSKLLYATWDGSQWSSPERSELEVDNVEGGVSATVAAVSRRLDILFRGESGASTEITQMGLWYTGRELPVVTVIPPPAFVPPPAATPQPTPSPAPSATPPPDFAAVAPATGGEGDLPLPILLAGGGALLIVAAAAGTSWLRSRRQ